MIRFLRNHPYIVTGFLLLAAWYLVTRVGWVGKSLLASPLEVAVVLADGFNPAGPANAVYHHAWDTAVRGLAGWSIALGLGSLAGLLMGMNSIIYRAWEPVVEFARAIPPIMAFPLLLVACDFGPTAYVWTIAIGCLPIMMLSVSRGIQHMDHSRLDLLAMHGASRQLRIAISVIEIMPATLFGARLTFSISLIVAIVTEMVFSPRSGFALGALAKDSQISFDTPTFYACILILGIYGYSANALIRHCEWRLAGELHRAS
jgi:ABC-type nitrate/sulfonate/bicarbonate transport system permease component